MTGDQQGQVLPLVVGLSLVVFAASGLAVDGARLWLLRRGLQNSADAAVLSAAARLDTDAFYSSGGSREVLDRSAAVAAARRLLASRGLAARAVITFEEGAVVAVVRARMPTSFLSLLGVNELPVVVNAAAAPVFGDAP